MTAAGGNRRFLFLAVILGSAGLVLPLLSRAPHFNQGLYFLATTLVSFELLDLIVRLWLCHTASNSGTTVGQHEPYATESPLQPFALVLSVHNLQPDAERVLKALTPFKANTWIIDDCSDDDTGEYLLFLGWRCLVAGTNRKKPAAIKTLLQRLPEEIRTVVVLDPDSAPLDSGRFDVSDLERAIRRFQQSGAAACCPQIRIREDGPLTSFQLLECQMAFALGRKGMSPHSITSGVSIYDRAKLGKVLDEHSLSVYAEDLENTMILLQRGERILYDSELVFETDGKRTLSSWFSQRVGWSFGLIRVFAERLQSLRGATRFGPWSFYNFIVYIGLLSIVLFPLKAAGVLLLTISFANTLDNLFVLDIVPDNAFTDPRYFAVTFASYTLLVACLVAYLRPHARASTLFMAVFFYVFYALAHVVPIGLGYLDWVSVRVIGRRLCRDHYSDVAHAGL